MELKDLSHGGILLALDVSLCVYMQESVSAVWVAVWHDVICYITCYIITGT